MPLCATVPLTTIMPRRLWLWRSSILRRLRFLRSTPPPTIPCLVFVFHSLAVWSISCQLQRTPAEKLRFWSKVHSHKIPKRDFATWFHKSLDGFSPDELQTDAPSDADWSCVYQAEWRIPHVVSHRFQLKTIVSQTDGLVLSGFDVDWKLNL